MPATPKKDRFVMGYTASAKPADLQEQWFYVDAEGQILGRLASDIAYVLRGKHMPNYTPHVNMKTHVIVLNAGKVRLTGKKWDDKKYYRHSGWVGGLRETNARQLLAKKPGELVRLAVWGMLPKNRLSHVTMTRLRIYASPGHNHQAQKPQPLPQRTAASA
jgi:large subunit ribosomal protein L13